MRKIIATIFITFLLFGMKASAQEFYYVNNYNISMTKSQYDNLISIGFSEQEIATMTQNEFELNKNLEGHVVESVTKYYKTTYIYRYRNLYNKNITNITTDNISENIENNNLVLTQVLNEEISKDEFDHLNSNIITTLDVNPAIHETNGKKLTTTISYISSNNQYRVKNDLVWKNIPSTRSYDIFGIRLNNSVAEPVSGSHYARTNYTIKETCNNTSTNYITQHTTNWKYSSHGYGVAFQLPKDSIENIRWDLGQSYPCTWTGIGDPIRTSDWVQYNKNVTALSSTMYFNITKLNSNAAVSAFGSYQHSIKTISLNTALNFSIDLNANIGGVFSMSISIAESFDGMQGTHAQILNPVW